MGQLVNGVWSTEWYRPDERGRFVRPDTQFRGTAPAAVAGRYHLYVSLACPWAHRTLLARQVKGLTDAISVSIVDPFMGADGWAFSDGPGCVPDSVHGARLLRDVYLAARGDYTGRVTVPVLWDRERDTIVNNESIEIVRMMDGPLAELGDPTVAPASLFPADRRDEVERVIAAIYEPINNGVYRCGFATSQSAYDEAVAELFAALDHWDGVLAARRYLCGDRFTAADICLFTTLVRFDSVYVAHFKCNLRRIADYPSLSGYLREIYQMPGVAQTTNFDHIKGHYFRSHESINPHRIVPRGPVLDLDAPHRREAIG